jgi:uncharacterized SAM-binding protein YcdF (DUF218 family)
MALAMLVGLAGLVYAFRDRLLIRVGHLLVHTDPLHHADAIVVLGGGALDREVEAADLFKAGWAPRIVLMRVPEHRIAEEIRRRGLPYRSDHELRVELLQALGVPAQAIVGLDRIVMSTNDEAGAIAEWARTQKVQSLIVVTTSFHTARTRFILADTLGNSGISLCVRASAMSFFRPDDWWQNRLALREGLFELQKLLFYRLAYGW